jgi:hypothetical protein
MDEGIIERSKQVSNTEDFLSFQELDSSDFLSSFNYFRCSTKEKDNISLQVVLHITNNIARRDATWCCRDDLQLTPPLLFRVYCGKGVELIFPVQVVKVVTMVNAR